MRHHLEALIVWHRVWSAFGAITALALVVLSIGTEAALLEAGRLGPSQRGIVWLFAGSAVVVGAIGAGGFIAARGLQRRRVSGRLMALLLALVNVIFVPFGTALGIYTFWVLLNNDARREFGRPLRGFTPVSDRSGAG
jgi:hypothetical protein